VFANENAGRMCSQLLYYFTPTKTPIPFMWKEKAGYRWIAMTREEFCSRTDLTPARYKAALAILEPLGVVYRDSGHKAGLRVTYLRLDTARLTDVIAEFDIRQELEDELTGEISHTGMAEIAASLIKAEGLKEVITWLTPQGTSPGKATGKPVQTTPEIDTGEDSQITLNKEIVTCAAEQTVTTYPVKVVTTAFDEKDGDTIMPKESEALAVLANQRERKAKLRADDKGHSLYMRWKSHMSEFYPDVEGHLTRDERGILGKFAAAVGYDRSIEALDFAFMNWYDIRSTVKQRTGEPIYATEPTPRMLLKHYQPILQLIADQKKKTAPPRSPNTVKPDKLPVVKVQPVPAAPAETLPTPQELEEMWAASLAAVKHKG
jgi:hypothetical protein